MKSHVLLLLVAVCITHSATSTAAAVRGREYVETERKIVSLTKQMVVEQRDVETFGNLVEELDATFADGSTQMFWQVARRVSESMTHELAECRKRLAREAASNPEPTPQKADVTNVSSTDSDAAAGQTPLANRVHKMQSIVRETDGLRNSMQFNDPSVIARYRHLVGEFHGLLEADIAGFKDEIESLRARNRG